MNVRTIPIVAGLIGAAAVLSWSPRSSIAVPNQSFEGIVVAVTQDSLTAMDPLGAADPLAANQFTFAVKQNVRITRNGKLARMDEIQPGDAVRITVRPLGDKLLALSIDTMAPPPPVPLPPP